MTNDFPRSSSPPAPEEIAVRNAPGASMQNSSDRADAGPESASSATFLAAIDGTETVRARAVLAAGTWPVESACDRITLDYEGRHRRRFRYVTDGRIDFVLDLAQTALLHDGDGLQLDDGRVIAVRAAPESLIAVTATDADALLRLAWHIGNRHLPAQLSATRILIRNDAVIVAMLRGLGATLQEITGPFTPERGAYAHAHETHAHPFVFTSGHENGL